MAFEKRLRSPLLWRLRAGISRAIQKRPQTYCMPGYFIFFFFFLCNLQARLLRDKVYSRTRIVPEARL
ncbi:hypothetical protein CPB83DRAFT_853639 [Crepidotus variabilis]|uniref:Uncharacterized protein n=1 Tax=Crepidotus variabilis TaxID=179855 RepID=A0A9P6JQB7_9AGAR|nr:hypothetical protein CPB83DRAFT_853639 [Crepidotus variabilis]